MSILTVAAWIAGAIAAFVVGTAFVILVPACIAKWSNRR